MSTHVANMERDLMAATSPIVQGYKYRVKRSQRYFEGLRVLPQWGGSCFEPYFRRTFEAFIALWKFQQQHRGELEQVDGYNMQRYEIGDIASKIGQLFYFYYLRTSNITSLNESYIFYEAIRGRQYFKSSRAKPEQRMTVLQKKLRFYARFVVVLLLKNYRALVWTLLGELTRLVEEYKTLDAFGDAGEWTNVIQELTTFLKADRLAWLDSFPLLSASGAVPSPSGSTRGPVGTSYRLHPAHCLGDTFWQLWHAKHPLHDQVPYAIKLTEAVLVWNKQLQVKFSELTLDMLRVMQSLEWESSNQPERQGSLVPPGSKESSGDTLFDMGDSEEEQGTKTETQPISVARSAPSSTYDFDLSLDSEGSQRHQPNLGGNINTTHKHTGKSFNPNPRKAMLYRPTHAQLTYVLSTAMMEMENRAQEGPRSSVSREATLLFLSAEHSRGDGTGSGSSILLCPSCNSLAPEPSIPSWPPHAQTLDPLSNAPEPSTLGIGTQTGQERKASAFYLTDLMSFTRNPLFLIIDAENASSFTPNSNPFGQPLVCLMSPQTSSPDFSDPARQGSVFTLFLTHPVVAFWFVMQKNQLSQATYKHAASRIQSCFAEDLLPMLVNATLDRSYEAFLTNDFTRIYILRFIFAKAVLKKNSSFTTPHMLPSCYPELPEHLFTSSAMGKLIEDLVAMAEGD